MKIEEAYEKLLPITNKTLKETFNEKTCMNTEKNKGAIGQAVEKEILGIVPGSRLLDFEDGQMLSNKGRAYYLKRTYVNYLLEKEAF